MKRLNHVTRRCIHALLGSIMIVAMLAQPMTAAPALSPDDTPEIYANVLSGRLTRADNLLFFTAYDSCPFNGEAPTQCKVQSKPVAGGVIRTLYDTGAAGALANTIDSNLAADEEYVYFMRHSNDVVRILRGSAGGTAVEVIASKETASSVTPDVAVDATYVYWAENLFSPTRAKLFRAPKAGGQREEMRNLSDTSIKQLKADGTGGVYYIAKSFFIDVLQRTFASGSGFVHDFAVSAATQAYAFDAANLYWADKLDGNLKVKSVARSAMSGTPTLRFNIGNTGNPQVRALGVDGTNIYWYEYRLGSGGPIYRLPLSGGPPQVITSDLSQITDLLSTGVHLLWAASPIFRLSTRATPVTLDLTGNEVNLEVIQSVQRPANDVPLVAGKETFVRLYGRIASSSLGLSSVNPAPNVLLYGARGSTPLPGSPLRPLNVAPIGNAPVNRITLDGSFLFRLPASWIDGPITLRGEVNPGRVLVETNYSNNNSQVDVTFNRKQTLCLDMVPVETTTGTIGAWSPAYASHFARAASLFPVASFRDVWRGGPAHRRPRIPLGIAGSDPYNLNSDVEMGYLLFNLTFAYLFSGTPGECGGLRTMRIAAVNNASRYGMAAGISPVMFFLMNYGGSDVNQPIGGNRGLAHELGHQQGRAHVLCPISGPNVPAGTDSAYLYPSCQIDNAGTNAHIGLDPITRKLLLPASTADFMSYGPEPLWASDYTYRALFNGLPNASRLAISASDALPKEPLRATAGEQLLVSGLISDSTALVNFAYQVSGTTLTQLQDRIASQAVVDGSYELRALDAADAIIASSPLNLIEIEAEGGLPIKLFFNLIAPNPDIARFEVVHSDSVIGKLNAGANAPMINITSPTAGNTLSNQINIAWDASDPDGDPLMFTLRYSNDNGATWIVLGSPTTARAMNVDLTTGLPGGAQALVEVIASDGVHSTTAVVGPFSVDKHAPSAVIMSDNYSELNASLTASAAQSETIVLRGRGYDAEDGNLAGASLQWQIMRQIVGSVNHSGDGEQLSLMGLPPGTYTVTLTVTDADGQTATATTQLTISPKRVFDSSVPLLDGACDDAVYADDLDPISLRYSDGALAEARFVHADGALFVCFSGLPVGTMTNSFTGIRVDGDNSGDSAATATDFGFFVGRDGAAFTAAGDGAGDFTVDALPNGLTAAISDGDTTWQAELRIAEAQLGGWNKLVKLRTTHYWRNSAGDDTAWPNPSAYNSPASWGLTALGAVNQLIDFAPLPTRTMGDAPFNVSAAISSGLPLSYGSLTLGICTVSGNTVTLLAPGTCTIVAFQAGNASYLSASPVEQSFTVKAMQAEAKQIFLPLVLR